LSQLNVIVFTLQSRERFLCEHLFFSNIPHQNGLNEIANRLMIEIKIGKEKTHFRPSRREVTEIIRGQQRNYFQARFSWHEENFVSRSE